MLKHRTHLKNLKNFVKDGSMEPLSPQVLQGGDREVGRVRRGALRRYKHPLALPPRPPPPSCKTEHACRLCLLV